MSGEGNDGAEVGTTNQKIYAKMKGKGIPVSGIPRKQRQRALNRGGGGSSSKTDKTWQSARCSSNV